MQITLNGFTFTSNYGVTNISSVLKNKDNKALAGIIKDGNKMAKMERLKQTNSEVLEFVDLVLTETNTLYASQKKSTTKKKKYNPNIHTVSL